MKLTPVSMLGIFLFIWYSCWRWLWYADAIKYAWAYKPINMFTAITSAIWLSLSVFFENKTLKEYMWWYAAIYIFLLLRNIWYTIEDVLDFLLSSPTKEYAFFILVDILMALYVFIWLTKFYRLKR